MRIPPELVCQTHSLPLAGAAGRAVEEAEALECPRGCRFPVVARVPRFTPSDEYATAFGRQWKTFRQTQLDSHTGTTISRDRLARCLGGSLDVLRGRTVLEVGCGAGRFTELMLGAGARVVACDLSQAVEANYENCRHHGDNYFVCQADVRRLPLLPASFDFVVCLGVIQHTPDPEETIAALARHVRPGGTLVIDHYTRATPKNRAQSLMRELLIRLPPRLATPLALAVSRALLPLHRLSWSDKRGRWRLRGPLQRFSPLADYSAAYPQLGEKLLGEWSVLDTHDMVTDYYKHLRDADEIRAILAACGLERLEVYYAGNGVEARARAPLAGAAAGAGGAAARKG
ncbi:MAG TPA: class I SAM-dependent methyltransferase [Pyrinomonadaceae bacterium]|nr:class I SAM-dependent methyltransferase [Pyrinomonadaceae bacterium]